ncbi:lytic transglycosylase domain-containing protein [Nocardioides sp.]|uniref:aggregation-promoting factor C-terminal-like domain-containing protein n=1 Tax=Nocardioides sp. TaxID=35761 RepID=UPI0035B4589F
MSKPDKYVPKHRAPGKHKAARAPRRALRSGIALTGLAAAVTGVSISGGMLSSDPSLTPAAADVADTSTSTGDATMSAAELEQRAANAPVSRSSRRVRQAAEKVAALNVASGAAVTKSEKLSEGDPRDIARALLPEYGFSSDQFSCLDSLYVSESGWRVDADNPTSSAYGIPQALTQLHDLPADYMTSAESQIRWGLEYIQGSYGTPCSAWSFKSSHGWY